MDGKLYGFDFDIPDNDAIFKAFQKCKVILERHSNILVSLSGGSDSDIMLDMIVKCKADSNNIHYVFFDTGLEFDATKKHLDYLEEKYGIKIERSKPKIPVPASVKKMGEPFFSKTVSDYIYRLQSHGFQWEDEPFDVLYERYPNCKTALQWWCNEKGDGSKFNIKKASWLKPFMVANPPDFKISNYCCIHAKKNLSKEWKKHNQIDLQCVGIRKAEGGARATIKSCFTEKDGEADEFRPVFWLVKEDKEVYNKFYGIQLSECYTKYGLKRTGCTGCPFANEWKKEVEVIDEYEPKFSKAVRNIFKNSYAYTLKYEAFRDEMNEKYGSWSAYLRGIEDGSIEPIKGGT